MSWKPLKNKCEKDKAANRCLNASESAMVHTFASSCSSTCNQRHNCRAKTTPPIRASVPDLGQVAMPHDVASTVQMIGQCIRCRNRMILQYMYKSARNKRCIFQTTLMLMGETGVGKSSVVNHLFNTDLVATSAIQSETRSVTEYTAVTSIEELRTIGVRLRTVDTPGFNDTDGLRQDACNLMAIKKYCEKNCCLRRSCFPNVILLCVKAADNRLLGPQSKLAESLQILKDLQVIDAECPNLILVMTHACSIGCNMNNVGRWKNKLRDQALTFQGVLKEHVGFEPLVAYIENGIDDNDLQRVNGGSVLPDGTIQPLNLFEVIMKLLQDNRDELGYATIREFYRRSSEGLDFNVEVDRSVEATLARVEALSEEEEACAKSLLQIGDDWELIRKSVAHEHSAVNDAIKQAFRAMEKQWEECELTCGESLHLSNDSTPLRPSFSAESAFGEKELPLDKRRVDAESKVLPPEDKDVAFQTIIIFILSVVGIVCLATVGVLGTIFLGPAGFAVGAGAGTACAFLCTLAKGCSSKHSRPDNESENGLSEDLQ